MSDISQLSGLQGIKELPGISPKAGAVQGGGFGDTLKRAIEAVDGMQKQSESAQTAYTRGDEVDLHEVLIKIEEAETAFKTMMEVRNKLVDAYREVMRMGG